VYRQPTSTLDIGAANIPDVNREAATTMKLVRILTMTN
jgi:hypothetical protein